MKGASRLPSYIVARIAGHAPRMCACGEREPLRGGCLCLKGIFLCSTSFAVIMMICGDHSSGSVAHELQARAYLLIVTCGDHSSGSVVHEINQSQPRHPPCTL